MVGAVSIKKSVHRWFAAFRRRYELRSQCRPWRLLFRAKWALGARLLSPSARSFLQITVEVKKMEESLEVL